MNKLYNIQILFTTDNTKVVIFYKPVEGITVSEHRKNVPVTTLSFTIKKEINLQKYLLRYLLSGVPYYC
jgi:viroplasmin and RNaseH domain-containing protein